MYFPVVVRVQTESRIFSFKVVLYLVIVVGISYRGVRRRTKRGGAPGRSYPLLCVCVCVWMMVRETLLRPLK